MIEPSSDDMTAPSTDATISPRSTTGSRSPAAYGKTLSGEAANSSLPE